MTESIETLKARISMLEHQVRILQNNDPSIEKRKREIQTWDLSNKNLTDDAFFDLLYDQEHELKKIKYIDLSNNPQITNEIIDYILENDNIGTIREDKQYSSVYCGGYPSEIYINAKNTQIRDKNNNCDDFKKCAMVSGNFIMHYRELLTNMKIYDDMRGYRIVYITF